MDPFSAEGELLNLHNFFHQGQYQAVVDFDASSLSAENALPARIYALRARVALGAAAEVAAEARPGDGSGGPELAAVAAYAQLAADGDAAAAAAAVEALTGPDGRGDAAEIAAVQVLGGIVLQAAGRSEEALALLSKHQGNLEAVALIVQIHLQQNRTDLALKEVQAARRWAQDSLLVNIAESWVGIRMGGEKYQQAFYVFEELAQAPSTSAPYSLVSQAVAELHLGRYEEAEAALQQALEKNAADANALANIIVLSVLAGKDSASHKSSLTNINPEHPLLTDLEEKSSLFDKAATKYSAKVAA